MPSNVVTGEDRAGIFSAVRHERFWRLWATPVLSGVGYMAALTACGWVPPFAGVFADRYDRRAMLLAMNAMGGGPLVGTFLLAGFARRVAP